MDSWQADALEGYVGSWLGDRQATVLDHGSVETNRALPWWHGQLVANGMDSVALSPDPTGSGAVALTRGALFTLATRPGTLDTDEGLLGLLWHVVWWGSGWKHPRVAPKIRSFADPADRKSHLQRLREATHAAQDGELKEAYQSLQPGSKAAIPNLGPSYFTKFLYFATGGGPALIIDQRAVESLLALHKPRILHHASGWSADEYVDYCETLEEWAASLTAANRPCQADELERALFAGKPHE
jgi:hypothetical protein